MDNIPQIKITETPRDGMQGIDKLIPAWKKIEYINLLLKCGFDTVEVGSFVSPKAIPQMADTAEVLNKIDLSCTKSKIAVLVANLKGGQLAIEFDQVDEIFYPFSASPTFLKKNLNTTTEQAERTIDRLQDLCLANNKKLVIVVSFAFGDPYGDDWSTDIINHWLAKLINKGINKISLADTIGDASPKMIEIVCQSVIPNFYDIEFGLHTHSHRGTGLEKIDAAWKTGIRSFDTVINGIGGCPMTDKEMVGNLSLEVLLDYCELNIIETGLNKNQLLLASQYDLYS